MFLPPSRADPKGEGESRPPSACTPSIRALPLCVGLSQVLDWFIYRLKMSVLPCAQGSDFLRMNSEVEKEPSGFEIPRPDDGFALPKFDGMEILTGHQGFPESGKTTPLKDIVPRYTENDNQTGGPSDQIEVSEDGGTVRKRKNSRGHCKQKKRFTCGVCGKSLSTKQSLQFHEFTHTGEKHFACRIYGKSFAQSSVLSRHTLTHTGEKPFSCRICGKAFSRSSSLSTHKLIHTGEKHFACRICGKSFAHSSVLSRHTIASVARFEGSRDFTVTKRSTLKGISPLVLCVISLSDSRTKLALHLIKLRSVRKRAQYEKERIREVTAKKTNALIAPYAANHYPPSSLQFHEFTHTGEKPFACRICGKTFARSSHLSSHTLIHTGDKPFACRICGKAFSQSSSLSKHKLTHTGENPYACRICGKTFARSSHLSRHRLIHTEEKPLACWICEKSFSQSGSLSAHKLTHTGEKPFACIICGKSFARSDSLSSHKLIHTGEKHFACRICGKSFAQNHHLATHLLIHIKLSAKVTTQPLRKKICLRG
ncbi:unnamed protein product, partial [Cyprideis torosa]